MAGHRGKCFPINAFFVDAEAAPAWFVLKDLVGELVDAGACFARACVAGNKPASAELVPFPSHAAETSDFGFRFGRDKEPYGEQDESEGCPHGYEMRRSETIEDA